MLVHEITEQQQLVSEQQVYHEALYKYTGQLMRQGQSDQQVQDLLVERGLMRPAAELVTRQMRSQFWEVYPPQSAALTLWSVLLGSALFCCQPLFSYLRYRRALASTES